MQNIPSAAALRSAADIKDRITSLQTQLENLLGGSINGHAKPNRKRRCMSPEARAKIAEAARLRWRKAKRAGRMHL